MLVILPKPGAVGPGRCYVLRAVGKAVIVIQTEDAQNSAPKQRIFGRGQAGAAPTLDIPIGEGITLITDGKTNWYAIADLTA
jgi:hypothetical protein